MICAVNGSFGAVCGGAPAVVPAPITSAGGCWAAATQAARHKREMANSFFMFEEFLSVYELLVQSRLTLRQLAEWLLVRRSLRRLDALNVGVALHEDAVAVAGGDD